MTQPLTQDAKLDRIRQAFLDYLTSYPRGATPSELLFQTRGPRLRAAERDFVLRRLLLDGVIEETTIANTNLNRGVKKPRVKAYKLVKETSQS